MKLRIGSRGSPLAVKQVDIIIGLLNEKFPELEFDREIIKTTGDKIQDVPLAKIGTKGLFVKEIDEAVDRGDVDFAVHSMKDVPTELLASMAITCVPKREPVNDALISREGLNIEDLPQGAVIGTSSLRRIAELKNYRSDFDVRDLRGNVDTRLRKVKEGKYDAIIMAHAGLKRLGFDGQITQDLPVDAFIPPIGQGAIAVVSRKDSKANKYLEAINDPDSMAKITAERALLIYMGGGCQVPLGTYTQVDTEVLTMKAAIISPDGTRRLNAEASGPREKARDIGNQVGKKLMELGAQEILDETFSMG